MRWTSRKELKDRKYPRRLSDKEFIDPNSTFMVIFLAEYEENDANDCVFFVMQEDPLNNFSVKWIYDFLFSYRAVQ